MTDELEGNVRKTQSLFIILNIILSLLLTNCTLIDVIANKQYTSNITSGIYYDGNYVIYTREYKEQGRILAETYTSLGEVVHIIDLNNNNQFVKFIENNIEYSIPLIDDFEDVDRVHLCISKEHVYITGKYLSYVYMINLNDFSVSKLDSVNYNSVTMYDCSPDGIEEMYLSNELYYKNKISNEIKEWKGIEYQIGYQYYAVNWENRLFISNYDNLYFINIDTDSTWGVNIESKVYKYGLKWLNNENILIDTYSNEDNQYVSLKDSTWQVVGTLPDKYFTMAEDSTYCLVDGNVVSIYDKDDVLIREIKITEEI